MKKFMAYSFTDVIRAYESENGTGLSEAVYKAREALEQAESVLYSEDTDDNYIAWELADKVFNAAFDARENAVRGWLDSHSDEFEFIY